MRDSAVQTVLYSTVCECVHLEGKAGYGCYLKSSEGRNLEPGCASAGTVLCQPEHTGNEVTGQKRKLDRGITFVRCSWHGGCREKSDPRKAIGARGAQYRTTNCGLVSDATLSGFVKMKAFEAYK